MSHVYYSQDLLESKLDLRKIVFKVFFIKGDSDSLHECGHLKDDFIRLCMGLEKNSTK